MKQRRTNQQQTSEIEIIADATQLIVNHRMRHSNNLRTFLFPLSSFLFTLSSLLFTYSPLFIPVAINHGGIGSGSTLNHAYRGVKTQQQGRVFQIEQHIFCRHLPLNLADGSFRLHTITTNEQLAGASSVAAISLLTIRKI